jgi:hypothetical protein
MMLEHAFSGGRAADVAHADEKNFDHIYLECELPERFA